MHTICANGAAAWNRRLHRNSFCSAVVAVAVLRALLRIIYLFSRADDNIVVVVVCFFLVVFGWGSFAEPFYLR